jgi:hypothetical protein
MLARMRVVFIFLVLLVLIALALPTTFAVRYWLDGRDVIARAEQSGELRAPIAGRLTVAEYMIAMNEFRDTWRTRAQPCRTFAYIWADLTSENTPGGMPVSQRFATSLLGEQRGTSIRWQVRRLIVACQLEQRFDDRQMLRLWLERAYFGREALGIENAARAYFGKSSSELDSNESARLAALLKGPGVRNQPERWTERARLIQNRVAEIAR